MKTTPLTIVGIALVASDRYTYIVHLSDGSTHYGRFFIQSNGLVAGAPTVRKPYIADKNVDLLVVGNLRMNRL